MDEIKNKMNQIFCEIFNNPDLVIEDEMTAADVEGWDSLSHLKLITSVEKAFDISISGFEVMGLKNIGDMIHLVDQKLNK